jgi:hypothetical protein
MKTLTIRQMPDRVHEALRIRAARNLRSMEEEVRRIIGDGLKEEIGELEGDVRGIDPTEIADAYERLYNAPGGTKMAVFSHFFVRGYTVNEVYKALSSTVFPDLIYQHVRNEFERWKSSKKGGAVGDRTREGSTENQDRMAANKKAAVDRLQAFVRKLWGGELPGDVVDSFLREKYEETARENAKDGF